MEKAKACSLLFRFLKASTFTISKFKQIFNQTRPKIKQKSKNQPPMYKELPPCQTSNLQKTKCVRILGLFLALNCLKFSFQKPSLNIKNTTLMSKFKLLFSISLKIRDSIDTAKFQKIIFFSRVELRLCKRVGFLR